MRDPCLGTLGSACVFAANVFDFNILINLMNCGERLKEFIFYMLFSLALLCTDAKEH